MEKEKSPIFRESVFYLAVGALLSVLGYLLYATLFVLLEEEVSYLLLFALSYLTMLTISYLTYSKMVFKSKVSWRGFLKYFLTTQLNAWLTLALVLVWSEVLLLNALYAPLFPLVILSPAMFLLSRKYIFSQKKQVKI